MSLQGKFIAKQISDLFWKENISLATAESCTAGNIAAAITAIPGSSHFFKGGIVAYSNEVKENLLSVNAKTIEEKGVVSEETVIEMVNGVRKLLKTDCAIATSGVAGPTGGSHETPVGTIWIAFANGEDIKTLKLEGNSGREKNVERATQAALDLIVKTLQSVENE